MDRFHTAVSTVLPLLEKLKDGLTPPPTASRQALHNLKTLAHELVVHERESVPETLDNVVDSSAATSPTLIPTRSWTLDELRAAAINCRECDHLVSSRTQVVFGVGNPEADLMFIGEAPGADEDRLGEPFVGAAGELLTKIIKAMGFTREDVYIANVLKCRPDLPAGSRGNRKPTSEEMATCFPWVAEQIRLVRPRVIVALGATASEGLLGETKPMRELRGQWLEYEEIPVMITFHPAYLLHNKSNAEKRKVWEDLLLVLERLGSPISEKQRRFFT